MRIVHRLLSGSVFRTAEYIVQVVITFVMTPFIIRSLGERMYGFWTIVAAFVGYYGLLDLGIRTAITRFVSRGLGADDADQVNRTVSTSLAFFLATVPVTVLLSLMAFVGVRHYFSDMPEVNTLSLAVLFLGLRMSLSLPARVFSGTLSAALRYDLLSIAGITRLVSVNTLIYVLLRMEMSIAAMGAVTLVISVLEYSLLVFFSYRAFPTLKLRLLPIDRDELKSLFRYSSISWANSVLVLSFTRIQAPLVAAFVTVSAVTGYSVADRLVQYYAQLLTALLGSFVPLFSYRDGRNDHDALIRDLRLIMRISVFLAVFGGLSMIAYGKVFLTRWLGPEFSDAYPVLVILTSAYIINVSQSPGINMLYALSKHHYATYINLVCVIFFIPLVVFLGKSFGRIGVAWATALPIIAADLLLIPPAVSKSCGARLWHDYFRIIVLTAMFTATVFTATFMFVRGFLKPDYSSILLWFLLQCILMVLSAFVCLLTKQERSVILGKIRGSLPPE